jgi:hypothetical protein
MVVFFAFAGLLVFWVALIALVKFEQGDVGVTPATLARIRLRVAIDDMARIVGESLLPAFRALVAQIVKATAALRQLDLSKGERGYILGATRRHIPGEYEGEPSSRPGHGPQAESLCALTRGGVYDATWIDFHIGDESRYPTCKRCEEAARRAG